MAAKRLSGPTQLTGSAVTQFTGATGITSTLRHVHVENPSVSAVTFTLSIGADGATTRVFDAYSIAAGAVLDWYPYIAIAAGEVVQAFAGTASQLVLTIGGDINATG